jgi:hypothetical protein
MQQSPLLDVPGKAGNRLVFPPKNVFIGAEYTAGDRVIATGHVLLSLALSYFAFNMTYEFAQTYFSSILPGAMAQAGVNSSGLVNATLDQFVARSAFPLAVAAVPNTEATSLSFIVRSVLSNFLAENRASFSINDGYFWLQQLVHAVFIAGATSAFIGDYPVFEYSMFLAGAVTLTVAKFIELKEVMVPPLVFIMGPISNLTSSLDNASLKWLGVVAMMCLTGSIMQEVIADLPQRVAQIFNGKIAPNKARQVAFIDRQEGDLSDFASNRGVSSHPF